MVQVPFSFVQELDDKTNKTIDGLTPGAWLATRYYPTDEEVIEAAKKASKELPPKTPIYCVEYNIPKGFEQYWPEKTYWQATLNEPIHEVTIGAYYHGRPNQFIIIDQEAYYQIGEMLDDVLRKSKEAYETFQANESEWYKLHPECKKVWTPEMIIGNFHYPSLKKKEKSNPEK